MPLKSDYNHIICIMEGETKNIRFVLKIYRFVLRLLNISFCGLYQQHQYGGHCDACSFFRHDVLPEIRPQSIAHHRNDVHHHGGQYHHHPAHHPPLFVMK